MTALEVLATGPLTTVQDKGRDGHAGWGVGASGAADRRALRLANRLVANPEDAAALEVTLGGLAVRPDSDVVVALTGARCPATVAGRSVSTNEVLVVHAGEELRLGTAKVGLRTYLAVRGGVDVPAVLGSRATDVLAHLGPRRRDRRRGTAVGPPPAHFPVVDVAPVRDPDAGDVVLRVRLGPRDDWFTAAGVRTLLETPWTVTPESNRVGMRSTAPARAGRRPRAAERGCRAGALRCRRRGFPTLFLADHPVTGGYPSSPVVLDADGRRRGPGAPGAARRSSRT
jgi:biotin-dependent carboxylase-like uncharacterized protein